ncbi:transcription-repair coupling factor (superfamily II helicase) [Desulfitispora alkaliphila]|uniref:transcription-repair coupling factor n=1 Tax=Desulfitispora alkaliphila TaxID=622674 RepID=UPI003D1F459A
MNMGLFSPLINSAEFKSVLEGLDQGLEQQLVYGLTEVQQAYFLASVNMSNSRPILAVTDTEVAAKKLAEELEVLTGTNDVAYLPLRETLPFTVMAASNHLVEQRMRVMELLRFSQKPIVVTSMQGLGQKMMPKGEFTEYWKKIKVGQVIDFSALSNELALMGYERVPTVDTKGQYSVRGGIIDVFPLTMEDPLRLEFFDDEIDSIRSFDLASQRSKDILSEIVLPPAEEILLPSTRLTTGKDRLEVLLKENPQRETLEEQVKPIIDMLEMGGSDQRLSSLLPLFYEELSSITDYFPKSPAVFILDPSRCWEEYHKYIEERVETFSDLYARGSSLFKSDENLLTEAELQEDLSSRQLVNMALLPRKGAKVKPQKVVSFSGTLMHNYHAQLETLATDIKTYLREGKIVVLVVTDERREELLQQALDEFNLPLEKAGLRKGKILPKRVYMIRGGLSRGFTILQANLVVITEGEIYEQQKKKAVKKKGSIPKEKLAPFVDLKEGDYVVHESHGIGKYIGIEKMEIGESHKDYFVIKYAGADKLYVPVDQVDLIQKYVGSEDYAPKLNKLGGNEWNKVKNRVKESVKEMAQELLKLYAIREAQPGFAFSEDNVWQREFEQAFPYEETPDQLRAIIDVKVDMEKSKPMERLLCGDVGYGKTEVALRAAFKAVVDGKQVAVLVPTTILAHQHFKTFKERLANYPVAVDVVSRFRKPKEQRDIMERVKGGRLDILLGTHRLLSKDIKFKDLGLLIVDEEQRFGVAHKEKLKQLKENIDVLTLSATPIPRTLHMSLIGARDLSVIETPPEDRYPVQTFVVEHSPSIIKEAVNKELGRGGQVFYLHNRVSSIEAEARKLQQLLPHAKIGVAHGRMREDQLEQVILKFLEQEIDLLVCTTIIENGIDIPNVNTLIVSEADKLGLSQLYQLRGRVGRSNRIAYAYFTYQQNKVMTEVAEKRLHAIKEFTQLGAGFKIAMRDLEIRGAGNILGPEQHGQMMAVGFDLYCRLLEQAVEEEKGREVKKVDSSVDIDIEISAYFSDEYIADAGVKIEFYKRLLALENKEQLSELIDELVDRFGELPPEATNLIKLAELRIAAKNIRVATIKQQRDTIKISFHQPPDLSGEKLLQLAKGMGRRISFNASGPLEIGIKVSGMDKEKRIEIITEIIGRVKSLAAPVDN